MTTLGELFVDLEADDAGRTITLRMGWDEAERFPLRLKVEPGPDGAWLRLSPPTGRSKAEARLREALACVARVSASGEPEEFAALCSDGRG